MNKYFLIIALLSISSRAFCQSQSDSSKLSLTPQEIALWADSLINIKMYEHHVPGASFAFIKGDSILYTMGYGFANLKDSILVNPFYTHFDMGSIPKALTAVAALQLVESDQLSLHEPINKWVPYGSNRKYPPITLHHLLTHSAGLDDISNFNSATKIAENVPNLDQFIKSNPPIQVMPPGKVISYSNLGYAIIGRMIESPSGISFPDYMHQNILEPLNMNHSSFHPKLSIEMESNRAIGYEFIDGEYIASPVNYQINSPAAGLRSSVYDMANFIILLLNDGRFKNKQILSEEMVKEMQSLQFSNHPNIQGIGYSLREEYYDGWRVIAQNGGWQGFNHDFYIIKELGIGIMISLNTDEGSQVGNALIESFIENFVPKKETVNPPLQNLTNPKEYVGVYRSNRYSRNTITKFGLLIGAISELEINLKSDSLYYYNTPLLYEGNDVFRRDDGVGKIAFLRDGDGVINTMVRSYSHYDANQKLNWYETSGFQGMLYLFIAFIQCFIFSISIVQLIFNLIKKRLTKDSLVVFSIQLASSLLPIIFVVGLILEFISVGAWDFQYGPTLNLMLLLTIPLLLIPFLFYMIYFFFKSSKLSNSIWIKSQFFISIFTLIAFLTFLYQWNFIGFKF